MIKLMSLKKQKQDDLANNTVKKGQLSAAHIRVQKDISELDLPKTMAIHFPNPDDLLNFQLTISPDEGFYHGGKFCFMFRVTSGYPHEPPKVLCTQKIYHPNIDLDGNVCLNILREDWKPVLSLNSVLVGLQYLFLEPNADDPLNKDAAVVLRSNRHQFAHNVIRSMNGGYIDAIQFANVTKT